MKNAKTLLAWGVCIAVLFAIALSTWMIFFQPVKTASVEEVISAEPLEEEIAVNESLVVGPIVRYETEDIKSTCRTGDDCHIRLWGIDADGLTALIVSDLTELFRQNTGLDERYSIYKFLFPERSDTLIFGATIASSGCCSLYAYDVPTQTFTRHGRSSSMVGGEAPSPDNTKIIRFAQEGAALEVLDVLSNSVIATVKAGPGESFSEAINGYSADPYGSYEWINTSSFWYEVFSSADELSESTSRPVKEKRTYIVR